MLVLLKVFLGTGKEIIKGFDIGILKKIRFQNFPYSVTEEVVVSLVKITKRIAVERRIFFIVIEGILDGVFRRAVEDPILMVNHIVGPVGRVDIDIIIRGFREDLIGGSF